MIPTQDEFCHCPHCGRRTRHSVVRERVLAPVLWCLSCFGTRVEAVEAAPVPTVRMTRSADAGQTFRLAG
ncbi:hypothetical protein WV31_16490 [Magnetospirillum sp. ME-1]|uniref:hypothetical protein n=1 Tax=Magnetospirillum sp. ME-1 TaxID=1639348 RepID=UPI000A17BC85|nr:hypothetical protein [Magnetospirillum sp. ME-1]ARJ67151.1 hypothetical protein WV31_16490 [Magnetospirillum sp. ME-1]